MPTILIIEAAFNVQAFELPLVSLETHVHVCRIRRPRTTAHSWAQRRRRRLRTRQRAAPWRNWMSWQPICRSWRRLPPPSPAAQQSWWTGGRAPSSCKVGPWDIAWALPSAAGRGRVVQSHSTMRLKCCVGCQCSNHLRQNRDTGHFFQQLQAYAKQLCQAALRNTSKAH